MICYICKKEFDSIKGESICIKCDEAAYLCNAMSCAVNEWEMTLELENQFWISSKKFVKSLISKLDRNLDTIEQAKQTLESIKGQIIEHLKFYHKDEAIVALMVIKEAARRIEINENNQSLDWTIFNEYSIAIKLTEFIVNIPSTEFIGAPIGALENGHSNFISAICLGRIYIILDENIRNSKFLNMEYNDIYKMAFEFIETEELKKYYDEYRIMGLAEKPEDYIIKNKSLRYKLSQENKTPEKRADMIEKFIKKEFGFTLNDLRLFSQLVFIEEFRDEKSFLEYSSKDQIFNYYIPQLAIFNKNVLKKTIFKDIGNIAFDNIINTFSINKLDFSNNDKYERALELMSIYETGELIILGRVDFSQNVSAFSKFVNSGHNVEMFKPGIKEHKSIKESQKKLSAYLAYVVADKLASSGYKLPMEKLSSKMGGKYVPRAEIDKILVGKKNILDQVGDLDVLALDEKEKTIFIIELKNYKPAIDSKDLFYKDKSKIEDEEVFRKIKKREEIINENIKSVVKYITGKEEDGYKVKSIFVTTRPNYYACIKDADTEYTIWANLIKNIEERKL